jgi:hypothetical protein
VRPLQANNARLAREAVEWCDAAEAAEARIAELTERKNQNAAAMQLLSEENASLSARIAELEKERDEDRAKLANLLKAIEQGEDPESRAGCGMVRYDEHMAALTAVEAHLAAERTAKEAAEKALAEAERKIRSIKDGLRSLGEIGVAQTNELKRYREFYGPLPVDATLRNQGGKA